jgi:Spy/CpxP family protein refolding chaperone
MQLKDVFALALVAGLTPALSAQVQPPPPGPEPAARQTRPVPPDGVSPFPSSIYRMNDVAKHINLTDKQAQQLNALTEKTQAAYQEKLNKLGTLTQLERGPRVKVLNQEYSADWLKGAQDILNPDQYRRYQQLNYQYEGYNAFTDPEVTKRLNLTDAQVRDLHESITWRDRQIADIDRAARTDREKAREAYRAYWKEQQERYNKFLTPEQMKVWQQITGEPYEFQPTFAPPPR